MILELIRNLSFGIFWFCSDIIYWTKVFASVIFLYHKRRTKGRRFDLYDFDNEGHPEKNGIIVPKEEIVLESPLSEEELETSADEIFIYGVNSKSESLIVRVSRNSIDNSEAWVHLKLADGRSYYLNQTNGYMSNTDGKITSFVSGGLKMYPLCPMRRWRIVYSGMLKEKGETEDKKPVFVKFTFIWTASSEAYDATSDLDIMSTAKAMAETKWSSFVPPVEKLDKALNYYCQSGVINGTVSVEDETEIQMYLFGEKIRYLGGADYLEGSNFKLILGVIPYNGLFVHFSRTSLPNLVKNLYSGFIVNPSSKIDVIEDGIIISRRSGVDKASQQVTAMFKTENQYEIEGNIIGKRMSLKTDPCFEGSIDIAEINFKIDGLNGYGFIFTSEIFTAHQKTRQRKKQKATNLTQKNRPLTIYFTEEECYLPDLAGGKGSSLGKLTKLSSEMKSEFIVPKGFVVTTAAYDKFLTHGIKEKIEKMKDIAYGNTDGNIHEACKTVQLAVERTKFPKELEEEIEFKLKSGFKDLNLLKFAVRSSATGEDTDQMSAAGQMETFLGVCGLNEILTAVKKCWASQFSYIAVEYKRQNGQILNSPMAVVVQEMVDCESSGVMFTCDPLTCNPSVIVITSNYGLGESVVSGSEEPDTIILEKLSDDEVKIKDIAIGLKQRKIVLADSNSSEVSGTVVQEVTEEEQNKSCINEGTAIKLGKLSLKIESYFKSLRDIEWGIKDEEIFILQSRPVTTGESTSDFEIMHEYDGPLRCEDDFFTTCNVGEVMPNAVSPLGSDVLNRTFTIIFMKEYRRRIARNYYGQSKYFTTGMLHFYNHLFIQTADILTFASNDLDSMDTKGMMISIFGRVIDDPEIQENVNKRNYPEVNQKWRTFCYSLWALFMARYKQKELKEQIFNYQMPMLNERLSSKEIFNGLVKCCINISQPFERHMDCSMASSGWNSYLFRILSKAKGDIDNDVYSDFAKFLASSTNVESADVPASMQVLAQSIFNDIDGKKFKNMPIEEAKQWLETTPSEAGRKYREFIKRHGHRCINELDIYSTPWRSDPKPLIKLLQGMSDSCGEIKDKEEADVSTILPHIKTPLNFKSKLLLKFVVPRCRNGIRGRENGKTILVKAFDNVRKWFHQLSKTMVKEGFIPDEDLLYFLYIDEIRDLLETRSPRIISRAKHRRKIFPLISHFKFPEISKGRPVPSNQQTDEQMEYVANLTMKGIPVSQGTVKGYARVAESLDEAAGLKPGEILITHSTDIAWSPYFPILGGVVTEIGGLISHGAVVSREYGLPCVVGLHGATKQFVTGDYVLLDGNKGILQRLSTEEETKL